MEKHEDLLSTIASLRRGAAIDADEIARLRQEIARLRETNAYRAVERAATAESRVASLEATLQQLVSAWEVLPGGHYSTEIIQKWLVEQMKPAIDKVRAALAGAPLQPSEADWLRAVLQPSARASLPDDTMLRVAYIDGIKGQQVSISVGDFRRALAIVQGAAGDGVGDEVAKLTSALQGIRSRVDVALAGSKYEPENAFSSADGDGVGFDLRAHLQRQREWSIRTFGLGDRSKGVVDHIRKELREIEAEPQSEEWIDVVILALDGMWRAGYSPEQIIEALVAKQAKNEARVWPDWRTVPADKAIEHDRSADAPPAAAPAQGGES